MSVFNLDARLLMKVTCWPARIRNWCLTHITKSTGRRAVRGAQKRSSAPGRKTEGHPGVDQESSRHGWRRGEITASPGYRGKETFVAPYFLKCLRLETYILSHLAWAAVVGLLRELPAPTCSEGSSEAGEAAGWLLLSALFRAVRGTTEDPCRQNNSAFTEHAPCKMEAIRSRHLFLSNWLPHANPNPSLNCTVTRKQSPSITENIQPWCPHTPGLFPALMSLGHSELKGSCMPKIPWLSLGSIVKYSENSHWNKGQHQVLTPVNSKHFSVLNCVLCVPDHKDKDTNLYPCPSWLCSKAPSHIVRGWEGPPAPLAAELYVTL